MPTPTHARITELPLAERIRHRQERLLSDNWYTLKTTRFEFLRSDGQWQVQDRETYDRGNGATVLLYQLARRRVMLTRQFRYPVFVNGWPHLMVEAVAGLLDEADPASRIRAEAEEEAGVRLRDVQPLFEAYMSPGSVTEKLHFFAAAYDSADIVGTGGGLEEEGEDIAPFEMDFDVAMRQVEAGEIVDAKTLLLLRWAERHLFGPPLPASPQPLLVFIAGPYRSGTGDREDLIAANVKAMQDAAVQVADLGHVPVLGEWVTLPLIEAAGGQRGDATWDRFFHPHAQALLERCDALLRIGGPSAGADAMVQAALARGLPVHYGLSTLTRRPA